MGVERGEPKADCPVCEGGGGFLLDREGWFDCPACVGVRWAKIAERNRATLQELCERHALKPRWLATVMAFAVAKAVYEGARALTLHPSELAPWKSLPDVERVHLACLADEASRVG